MKRGLLNQFAACGAGLLLLAGCATHHPVHVTPTGDIVVSTAPPAPRPEEMGIAPSANHVWVPGYWAWTNNHYTWVPGRWELRPRENANWVAGHWNHTAQGWIWTPGHWE